ncbi:MAG: FAD:protein FMN transferase [Abitibacteriaceae bacterium]|nr:FAD:protein FMN transferase [Abditibacteriaceae bacterium]
MWELFIVGEAVEYAQQVAQTAFEEVDRLERELSRFIPSSDIFRINALQPGESMRVGLATLECLQLAAEVHEQTNGAFDITVGAWLDQRRDEEGRIQLSGASALAAKPCLGMELLEIDPEEYSVGWRADGNKEGVSLDLGAVGKGYALDCIAAIMRDWQIQDALIHSGQSTVLALGTPDAEHAWIVALRDPRDGDQMLGQMYLHNRAMSGSGMVTHGQHIVDPRTGEAAQGKLSTWAIADSAAYSDALSTAFMVMAPEEVEQYCQHHESVVGLLLVGDPAQPSIMSFGELARLESTP